MSKELCGRGVTEPAKMLVISEADADSIARALTDALDIVQSVDEYSGYCDWLGIDQPACRADVVDALARALGIVGQPTKE